MTKSIAYENVRNLLNKARSIVLTTHAGPDADGIGSELALCLALRSLGKKAVCVNEGPLPDRYRYLDPENVLISFNEYKQEGPIDLFIVVDTNHISRIGARMGELVQKSKHVLFVDHHPCPPTVERLHCIDTSAAATGQVVGELIEYLGIELTQKMALPLYTAILIDTSSFRYPTVSGKTHTLLAKLVETGVNPPQAYNMIYGAKKVGHMQLLGKVLSNAQTNEDQEVAWLSLSDEMIHQYGADIEDTHSFVNYLLVLDKVKVACMFRTDGKNVRVGLRSTGEIDVGLIAEALGGGGHNHSAATLIEGKMEEVVEETIDKIEKALKSPPPPIGQV
ncbi:MAG: bifunctional oligoribonuclease/PAP phosphatase NrnA [Bacteriovoracales bacterium]|nr:bifunctional oligoribonuclease/PAP phosphatase NrnA [Bacteriovoracales bacterium]